MSNMAYFYTMPSHRNIIHIKLLFTSFVVVVAL